MELLRIRRQIHCKAVEQRATLIHRQYNRDWGTSYSRPPYLTPPPCHKILAAPLLSSEGRRSAGGAQGPNARKDGTGWSLPPPSSRRVSDEAVVAVASSVDEPCAAAAGGCLRSSSSAGRASPATAISPRPSRPSSRQTPPPTCLQHATPPHHHRLTLHGCSR